MQIDGALIWDEIASIKGSRAPIGSVSHFTHVLNLTVIDDGPRQQGRKPFGPAHKHDWEIAATGRGGAGRGTLGSSPAPLPPQRFQERFHLHRPKLCLQSRNGCWGRRGFLRFGPRLRLRPRPRPRSTAALPPNPLLDVLRERRRRDRWRRKAAGSRLREGLVRGSIPVPAVRMGGAGAEATEDGGPGAAGAEVAIAASPPPLDPLMTTSSAAGAGAEAEAELAASPRSSAAVAPWMSLFPSPLSIMRSTTRALKVSSALL
jgi:hypothetical protein